MDEACFPLFVTNNQILALSGMYGTSKNFRSVAASNPLFVDKPDIQIASNLLFWDKHRPNFGPSNPLFLDKKWPELPGACAPSILKLILPVNFSAAYAYSTEKANGAVLLMAPEVVSGPALPHSHVPLKGRYDTSYLLTAKCRMIGQG